MNDGGDEREKLLSSEMSRSLLARHWELVLWPCRVHSYRFASFVGTTDTSFSSDKVLLAHSQGHFSVFAYSSSAC